jgi:hypothetical protein
MAAVAAMVCTFGFARSASALDSQGSNGLTVSIAPVDASSSDDGQEIVAALGSSFGLTVTAVAADGSAVTCDELSFSDDGSGLSSAVALSDNGDGTCLLSVNAASAGGATINWSATDSSGNSLDSGAFAVLYVDQGQTDGSQKPDGAPSATP